MAQLYATSNIGATHRPLPKPLHTLHAHALPAQILARSRLHRSVFGIHSQHESFASIDCRQTTTLADREVVGSGMRCQRATILIDDHTRPPMSAHALDECLVITI